MLDYMLFKSRLGEAERALLEDVFELELDKSEIAAVLGVHERTVYRRLDAVLAKAERYFR